jgi:hypothetical protein
MSFITVMIQKHGVPRSHHASKLKYSITIIHFDLTTGRAFKNSYIFDHALPYVLFSNNPISA